MLATGILLRGVKEDTSRAPQALYHVQVHASPTRDHITQHTWLLVPRPPAAPAAQPGPQTPAQDRGKGSPAKSLGAWRGPHRMDCNPRHQEWYTTKASRCLLRCRYTMPHGNKWWLCS